MFVATGAAWPAAMHSGGSAQAASISGSGACLRRAPTPGWMKGIGSVGEFNVAAAAVAVSAVARFGLRPGHRWAWWFLLFSLLWVGVHDAVVATLFFMKTGAPLMLTPYTYCALMIAGLARARRNPPAESCAQTPTKIPTREKTLT